MIKNNVPTLKGLKNVYITARESESESEAKSLLSTAWCLLTCSSSSDTDINMCRLAEGTTTVKSLIRS